MEENKDCATDYDKRKKQAIEQCKMESVPIETIIKHIKSFFKKNKQYEYGDIIHINYYYIIMHCLKKIGNQPNHSEIYAKYSNGGKNGYSYYDYLKDVYGLKKRGDIIWIKFTKSGHIAVVGKGYDVSQKKTWEYGKTTAGKLLAETKEEWDKENILIIPIKNGQAEDVEKALGDYLTKEKNIPIIDYYSHNGGKP